MSSLMLKIGCFKCGEVSVKDFDNTFNKVSCQLCGNENNASELLIDQIHFLNEKTEKLQEQNKILREDLEKISTDTVEVGFYVEPTWSAQIAREALAMVKE